MLLRNFLPVTLSILFLVIGIVFERTEIVGLALWFSGLTMGLNWDSNKKYINSILDTPVIKEEKRGD